MSFRILRCWVVRCFSAAALGLCAATAATASDGPLMPVEDFVKRPEFGNMSLSPSGRRLAATVPHKGRDNLVVIDLDKRTRSVITGFDTFDVLDFSWVNNDRLIFRAGFIRTALAQVEYRGTYAVDHDGANLSDLSRIGARSSATASAGNLVTIVPMAWIPGDTSGEFIVAMNLRRREAADVYRLNTRTGRNELLTFDSPADTTSFVLDNDRVPRIAVAGDPKNSRTQVWYRSDAKSAWSKLTDWDSVDPRADQISPLRFDADNKTLIVSANVGRNLAAIYRYDPSEKKLLGRIAEDPLVDLEGGLIWSGTLKKLVGVRVNSSRPYVQWLDPAYDRLQKQIDATFPGYINSISLNATDESFALVRSRSGQDIGRYHLFDRKKETIETLPDVAAWWKPSYAGERKYFEYLARDGLNIPAWISLPPGEKKTDLPLIVNIHGGPYVRGYDFFPDGDSFFFANRGYVVLEPEPRGSTGYGKALHAGGMKEWGQKMQDDITDGILALFKAGVVDRSRVCLYGGSYGGYATLMGMVKEPGLIKCGVATVAVTDLELFQKMGEADYNNSRLFNSDHFFKMMVGDLQKDAALIAKSSPARRAHEIKGSILLAMGAEDQRVPIRNADAMVASMKRAGVDYDYVVYSGEGHGFLKEENRIDFFNRAEKFLAKHIGGRSAK